jgi:hypothetical protein
MQKRQQRIVIASIVFVVAVLLFTGLDYLINSIFYFHGLQYSDSWYWPYTVMYTALYQIVIVCLTLYTKSWRLLLVTEAFSLSGCQDLVYFGLWNLGVFPAGSWDWLIISNVLNIQWLTWMQLVVSLSAISVTISIAALSRSKQQLKIP